MSAYIVSNDTVILIAANYLLADREDSILDSNCVNEIANELLAENYRSVNYRYNENDKPDVIKSSLNHIIDLVMTNSKAQVLKCCHCLNYQSYETDDYEESDAYSYIAALIKSLNSRGVSSDSPDYENAKWGI